MSQQTLQIEAPVSDIIPTAGKHGSASSVLIENQFMKILINEKLIWENTALWVT